MEVGLYSLSLKVHILYLRISVSVVFWASLLQKGKNDDLSKWSASFARNPSIPPISFEFRISRYLRFGIFLREDIVRYTRGFIPPIFYGNASSSIRTNAFDHSAETDTLRYIRIFTETLPHFTHFLIFRLKLILVDLVIDEPNEGEERVKKKI